MEPTTDTTTDSTTARSRVLVAFLMPHVLLELPSADDSPEARQIKIRRSRRWLLRWLPTYIGRWALIFLVVLITNSIVAGWNLPVLIDWLLQFATYASGGLALGFAGLYVLSYMAEK